MRKPWVQNALGLAFFVSFLLVFLVVRVLGLCCCLFFWV